MYAIAPTPGVNPYTKYFLKKNVKKNIRFRKFNFFVDNSLLKYHAGN